jgi:hypothetical protein
MANRRQIRYKKITDPSEQDKYLNHRWAFFILNTRREANEIVQKIFENFGSTNFRNYAEPTEQESEVLVKNKSSLRGRLLTLESNVGILEESEKRKIYNVLKNWHRDRRLRPMDEMEFIKYCQQFKR